MQVGPEKTIADDVVQISDVKMVINDVSKRPMVFGKSVNPSVQRSIMANDHKASSGKASSSSSASKYFQPRWCPSGLTRTQKRKLQHLRFQEKKEQEIMKLKDKQFNQRRPMVP